MAICEALCNFNATTSTIRSSFNVTSITVGGTPYYQVNFTTPISTINYVALCTAGNGSADSSNWLGSGPITNNPTTSNFPMWSGTASSRTALNYLFLGIFTN